MRNVLSLTLPITTPGTAVIISTSSSAWLVSRAATVTSIRRRSSLEAVTSSAVTAPPACSTAVVSWLTEAPPAGTSNRTVIEYDADGMVVMTSTPSWSAGLRLVRKPVRLVVTEVRTGLIASPSDKGQRCSALDGWAASAALALGRRALMSRT